MRDRETVDIGLRAAITGHMVFSTLHTTSAVATIDRMIDMGAPPYMVAAALHAVLAQRLIRRICQECAEPHAPDDHELAWLRAQVGPATADRLKFRHGLGCGYCNMTGYRGRVAVYELLEIDREQADAIRRNDLSLFARLTRTRRACKPLRISAIELAARGVTTLGEAMSSVSGIDTGIEPAFAESVPEPTPSGIGDEELSSAQTLSLLG